MAFIPPPIFKVRAHPHTSLAGPYNRRIRKIVNVTHHPPKTFLSEAVVNFVYDRSHGSNGVSTTHRATSRAALSSAVPTLDSILPGATFFTRLLAHMPSRRYQTACSPSLEILATCPPISNLVFVLLNFLPPPLSPPVSKLTRGEHGVSSPASRAAPPKVCGLLPHTQTQPSHTPCAHTNTLADAGHLLLTESKFSNPTNISDKTGEERTVPSSFFEKQELQRRMMYCSQPKCTAMPGSP